MNVKRILVWTLAVATSPAFPFTVDTADVPRPSEKTAADELRHYLQLAAQKGEVTIGGAEAKFHVGDTVFAEKHGMMAKDFADEAWAVKSFGSDVILNGGGSRGVLYAVYSFLEKRCDIHWWNDGDEDVPAAQTLCFDALDMRGKPFFLYRDIFRSRFSDPKTAIRNRLNGNGDGKIPETFGGGFVYGPPYHIHTWEARMPYRAYSVDHPEWFSYRDGRRIGGMLDGQLCLENEEMRERMTELVRADIVRGEWSESGQKFAICPQIYDVSMNDNVSYCMCDKCRDAAKKYGFSGQMIRFTNAIARRLNRPDLLFSMAAYHYSELPPTGGVMADDNVVVKLALTLMNMAAPITDPCNAESYRKIAEWKKYCKHIFLHEYGTIFTKDTRGFPYPSEFVLAEKYRTYADNNVQGHLIEHEPGTLPDMFELKFYMECKLMEDPYQDASTMISEFLRKYYGAAGDKIFEARLLLKRLRDESKASIVYFPFLSDFNFITAEAIEQADRLFKEAAAAVRGNAKLEKRVANARGSLDRISDMRRRFNNRHPPEAGVSDKPFIDYPATRENFYVYRKAINNTVTVEKDPSIGDPLAGGAMVLKLHLARMPEVKEPFKVSILSYPNGVEKPYVVVGSKKMVRDDAAGYTWQDLGTYDFPKGLFFVHFNDYFEFRKTYGICGTRKTVKALMKVTGDSISIARLAFVD